MQVTAIPRPNAVLPMASEIPAARRVWRSAAEMLPGDPDIAEVIKRLFSRLQALFAATIAKGQAAGEAPQNDSFHLGRFA